MGNIGFYQEWMISALFWLGVCIACLGIFLLVFPGKAVQLGYKMNRWVSTDSFFAGLDKPHFRERVFYRWHRSFGAALVVASVYIIYMFVFHANVDSIANALPIFAEREVNRWLYEAMKYFFIMGSVISLLIGLVIFIRPSMLKKLEGQLNIWVGIDKPLEKLNESYEIPENILPGNVRIFGTFVLVSGIYMVYMLF